MGVGGLEQILDIQELEATADDIEILANTIDGKVDIIDTNVDDIETLANTIDGKVDIMSGLVYSGDVTTYTNANNFASTDLIGFGDDFFIPGWRVYVVHDAGGAGAAPQGEYALITDYDSDTGAFTHAAFTAILAETDRVMVIHPVLYETLTIRGGAETIADVRDWQKSNLDLAGDQSTKSFTAVGGDEAAYERDESRPFRIDKLLLNLTGADFTSGNIVVKLFKKIKSGGAYAEAWIKTYAAIPASPLVEVGAVADDNSIVLDFPLYNTYGAKMTIDVSDDQDIDVEAYDSVVGG